MPTRLKLVLLIALGVGLLWSTESNPIDVARAAASDVIITEIMYDPNSAEDDWEWVEIYNSGVDTIDLSGWVIDDVNTVAHTAANIAAGSLAPGEQAILFNADDLSEADFEAAWGDVNLIPITNWTAMALNNSGDTVSLWDSFESYDGDNATHANATDTVNYGGAGFADPVGASLYLTDLLLDNNVGANWAASTDGGATPLFEGYASLAAGGNVGGELGSPGTPAGTGGGGEDPVINEFSASTTGADVEYVEIFGEAETDYSALTVLEIEGDSGSNMGTVDEVVAIGTTDASGFYLASLAADTLENGTISLLLVSNFSGAAGNDLDTDNDGTLDSQPWDAIVDAVAVNDGGAGDLNYGEPALGPNYDGLSSFAPGGASRIPDGEDTDSAADWARNDFDLLGIPGFAGTPQDGEALNTPGAPNELITASGGEFGVCGDPATLIHDIQGNGAASPVVSEVHVVEGVVTGLFPELDGGAYAVQEEAVDVDADPATSEGIMVFDGGNSPAIGDTVRVQGTVAEDFSNTQLEPVAQFANCGIGTLPAPETLSLPVTSIDDFEPFEGMYVIFTQDLNIAEYFNFDRFGEIVLTNSRWFQPTAIAEPVAPNPIAADYLLNRILLDDASSAQNPAFSRHPNGSEFTLGNLFRGGDIVRNVEGVLQFAFSLYRIQPTAGADFEATNPRSATPDDVGGEIQVASFNVLNYFTTLDTGAFVCGPSANLECRGADDAGEFTRQRDKIIAAISTINADIVGLIEIENHPADVPTADLVDGLNAVMGPGTYAYVTTGAIGTDAIRQAFIYKPASVTPIGSYAILDSSVDPDFIDTRNRPVLAQTFMENASGNLFTVAVNHLKSKGSACDPDDPDLGDGAGNCNLTRAAAAQALVDWLATDPTSSGDPDFLIIGDLNSYDYEDPIDVLTAAGFVDLARLLGGDFAYSYVFDGQLGYLDYGLSNASLTDQVTGATEWHINADEVDLLDYDTTFKPPEQEAIYEPNAYRSSDHDPVIIGLSLATEGDGDGIDDTIDTDPGAFSNDFSDGTTFGSVLDRGDQTVTVEPAVSGGIQITADNSGGNPAIVSACDAGEFRLDSGESIIVTCGSVIVEVVVGPVDASFMTDDGEVTVSLETGFKLSFDPDTDTFTADPGNPSPVILHTEDGDVSLEPGETYPEPVTAPSCNGQTATVYVNAEGRIVGGSLDGQRYYGVLLGTNGADVVVGTNGGELIVTDGGADIVCAEGGNDIILAGAGNDSIDGGPGSDLCSGGAGRDTATRCEIKLLIP